MLQVSCSAVVLGRGFWTNLLDPKKVYANVQPVVFNFIKTSGFYDFAASFVPPLGVYTIAVASTTTLVILTSLWLA